MSPQTERPTGVQQRIDSFRRSTLLISFAVVLTIGLTAILSFDIVYGTKVSLAPGDIVENDVIAPRSATYVSQILTEAAIEQAASDVQAVYDGPDLNVWRQQNNRARAILAFIETVRADNVADITSRIESLKAIEDVELDTEIASDILELGIDDYAEVRQDILRIIEESMRGRIDAEGLTVARRNASRAFSYDISLAQERVVTAFAPQLVVPNTFFNELATEERRREASSSIMPVTQIISKGDRILRMGEVVDEADLEALEQLGLLKLGTDWQRIFSVFLIAAVSVFLISVYWQQYATSRQSTARYVTVLALLILLFALAAKLFLPAENDIPFLYPAAALSMLVAVIFDVRLSILVTVIMASIAGMMSSNSLEIACYTATGGLLAVLTLRDTQRINALFRAGLVAALGNIAVILIFRLPAGIEWAELARLLLFGLLNGPIISASLTLAGLFVIGTVFGITTLLHLQELSRLDHPLLQDLLRKAPGTYHHSIMVANLAEQAAERIKADSTVVRVGAFYHDIGKMNRAPFFTENQNGANPHDTLDPYSSARIILSHVTDGLDLARRSGLPHRVRHFISEHHGDRTLKTFYRKAVEAAAEGDVVDENHFRYDGPRPRSRETGLVQLADSIDATSNALRPSNEDEIERLVNTIIDEHLKEGQLDNSGLTLGDLQMVRETFIENLNGRFHTRIRYPGNEEIMPVLEAPDSTDQPAIESGLSESDGADEQEWTGAELRD